MLFKIEPNGGTHAKEPPLGDDEIIVCNNAQEKTLFHKATNETCFFLSLEGCER
jgi:hypothetical protein